MNTRRDGELKEHEFVTEILDESRWPNIMSVILEVLSHRGVQTVNAEFGFVMDRDLRGEKSPADRIVPVRDLGRIIQDGLCEGTIEWGGGSDFRFSAMELPLRFMLCNDSDLHFSSTDIALLLDLAHALSRLGIKVYHSGKLVLHR